MNLENDSRWNNGTAVNRRYSKKQMLRNSKGNMLRNSISVNINVYALQLKQKSTVAIFRRILRNFRILWVNFLLILTLQWLKSDNSCEKRENLLFLINFGRAQFLVVYPVSRQQLILNWIFFTHILISNKEKLFLFFQLKIA